MNCPYKAYMDCPDCDKNNHCQLSNPAKDCNIYFSQNNYVYPIDNTPTLWYDSIVGGREKNENS